MYFLNMNMQIKLLWPTIFNPFPLTYYAAFLAHTSPQPQVMKQNAAQDDVSQFKETQGFY